MATMQIMAVGGGVVLLAVLTGFYYFNRRSIVRPLAQAIEQLQATGEQTVQASDEITHTSQRWRRGPANRPPPWKRPAPRWKKWPA